MSLVVVLDTSGSMLSDNRIGVARQLINGILDRLTARDRVALVTYGSTVQVAQPFVSGAKTGGMRSVVGEIYPDGSTYVEGGIRKAYELAAQAKGLPSRMVVIPDGVGNLGATGPDSILKPLDENAVRGTVLTALGMGVSGNYNDVMLETLANRGNGTYHYIQDRAEAAEFLGEAVQGILVEVARDARVQVEFNPEAVRKYRLIGYENRAVKDSDFRDDTLDFGELGFARDVTALYELRLFDEASDEDILATARLRWRDALTQEVVEVEEGITLGEFSAGIGDTAVGFRLAAGVAEFAELMRKSYWAQCGDLASVRGLFGGEVEGDLGWMLAGAEPLFEGYCEK